MRYNLPFTNVQKLQLTPQQYEFYLETLALFFNAVSSINVSQLRFKNPWPLLLGKLGLDNVSQVIEVFRQEHPIMMYYLGYYHNTVIGTLDYEFLGKYIESNKPELFKFLISEIKSKFTIETLLDNFSTAIRVESDPFMYIIESIHIITRVYLDNALKIYTPITNYRNMGNYVEPIVFGAQQLIDYLFEHDVNMNDFRWLSEVPYYQRKHDNALQTIQISVNYGTSKPFTLAILTELLQNSIDDSRSVYTGNIIQCKDNVNKMTLNNGIIENKRPIEDGDKLPYCPNAFSLKVGRVDGKTDKYVISAIDYVGIPIRGIISLCVPFLSTKKEGEALSTGEMGTGFMNVYRQPFTEKVVIQTRDPDTGYFYKFIATPVVENKKVVDIIYSFAASKSKYNKRGAYTNISIYTNKLNKEESTKIVTDSYIYALKYFPNIPLRGILILKK